ncbi:CATRA conflict system CASPASE/TPR repeat-associated protein [Pseudonocardia lacus]|uniref:CATRA conflict system CASPASE/TPR repeat-associated protein n=1 Tax=Pseudonocardia lacus TaxID=2835865 RepID=UPI0020283BF4|nr:CATRA conflict system CASPASE/TPR repeat-associated protein [Pseudonocardia lacus]
MTATGLIDEELVVHLFAPLDGPHAGSAYEQLRALLGRCRDQLGMTQPIRPPDLDAALPVDLPAERPAPGNGALAALEDRASDFQAIVRREQDVLAFSMVFAAPLDSTERRLRVGSAAPNGWLEFDRWWQQLAPDPQPLLGTVLIYQAKVSASATAAQPEPPIVPPHPSDDLHWQRSPALTRCGFPVWETSRDDSRARRRLVVLAGADEDRRLSAWTWSDGRSPMPPLGRYLMHAAKLRYHGRVLGDGARLVSLRRRVSARMDRLQVLLNDAPAQDPAARTAEERTLPADEAELMAARTDLSTMARTVEIAIENMARSLNDPLPTDRALAGWLPHRITDEDEYLSAVQRRAEHLRGLLPDAARSAGPVQVEPPRSTHSRPAQPAATSVGGPAAAPQMRLLFAVDVAGYSGRTAPQQDDMQRRLAAITHAVLGDLRITMADTDHQGTGDGLNIALPARTPITEALPMLLTGWQTYLGRDNGRYRDRMRLRLALAVGMFAHSQLGFTGQTIVEVNRLLDSDPLRHALVEHPDTDLVVMVSDHLYDLVVRPGFPGLEAFPFREHHVEVKTYRRPGWLWVAAGGHHRPGAESWGE